MAGLLEQSSGLLGKTTTPNLAGSISMSNFGMSQSTPQTTNLNITPLSALNTYKDIFLGGDNTTGGTIRNTILGLPQATLGVAKNIGQQVARSVASIGITAGNAPAELVNRSPLAQKFGLLTNVPFDQSIPTAGNPLSSAIFGGQPVQTVQKSISDVQKTLEPYIGKTGSNLASAPLVLAGIGLDLSMFGGGKGIKVASEIPETFFKAMVKETSPGAIEGTLRSVGMDETLAKTLAPDFAKSKTVEEAKNVLLDFGKTPETKTVYQIGDQTFNTTKEAVQYQNELMLKNRDNMVAIMNKTVQPIDTTIRGVDVPVKTLQVPEPAPQSTITPETSKVSPDLQPLAKEAQKYSSAEEFVKAQEPIYHGADQRNIDALNKNGVKILSSEEKVKLPSTGGGNFGISMTTDKATAQNYSGAMGNKNVGEFYLNPNAKVKTISGYIDDVYTPAQIEKLAKSFDVIKSTASENEVRILTNNGAVTKSQLTDIWNKVKGETLPELPKIPKTTSQVENVSGVSSRGLSTQPKEKAPILEPQKNAILKNVSSKNTLPQNLQQKQTELELKKEALGNNPLKQLERFVAKKGDLQGSLPEFGMGNSMFAKRGDVYIDEIYGYGNKYAEDVRTAFHDEYLPAKAEVKRLETELKTAIKEFKSQSILNGMRDRLAKQQEKMIEFSNKYPKLATLILDMSKEAEMGAKKGYKLGVEVARQQTRDTLISSFREKNLNIENAKKQIVEYANNNLPLSERGKLMTVVRDAKSQEDVIKAFSRIDRKVEEVKIKEALTNLKTTVEKISDNNAISADYRAKIKDIIDNYELQGHTQATIDKLNATQDYINRQASIGENVELPQRIMDKLKILDRTPKDQLTLTQIQTLQNEVELLAQLGETKWSSKQALYDAEKDLRKNELLNSATSINSKEVKNIGLEKNPPKYIQTYIKARNYLQKTRIGLTPIEGLADITGMQPMKKVMDLNFGNYLTYNDATNKQWLELTKDFDETNFKRIGAYAISEQKGGVERLANNGLTQEQIDNLKLTPEEMKVYKFARETFDKEFPAVKKYALDNYNKDVGEVKNYVSFMSDNDAMNELEMYDRFGTPPDFPTNTKTVEKGFTEQRAKLADNKMELNIDKIFRRHTDDVAYMLTMGRDIKQYFEIVNSPEMRAKLGDVGSVAWMQYLDLMARKGGSEGAKRIAILDTLRKNLSVGVLAFRISSAMVQFTSFADTMGTIGVEWAMKGASSVATSKEWRNFVMDNFPEVKKALGDDIAFREFGDNFLSKIGQKGLIPLEKLDNLMRVTAVVGQYQKILAEKGITVDFANPDKDAIQEATKLMRHSQGSSFFKDQPLSITTSYGLVDNKSVNKLILTFQSFILARWDNLQRQIWRLGIKEKNYAKASMSFLWMVIVAAAMEEGIRRGTKYAIGKGTELVTGKEDQTNYGSFAQNSVMNVVQTVPLAGSIISSMEYGSNPIPVINAIEQAQSGLTSTINGKTLQTKLRGVITTAGAVGSLSGIPGSSQGAQLVKGLVPAGSQIKKTVQGYQAIQQGKSTDAAGRAQFSVGGTVAKDALALLFGKYANPQAQAYFNGDTYAEQKYQELLKSPTAKADFEKIIQTDPNLAKNILAVKQKIDLGITKDDEKILAMGVQNEARAKYIANQFNKLKTKEEKGKLWEEYTTKKIITKEVAKQIGKYLK